MNESGLRPGTFLEGGKYRIIRQLGSGGFGITYLAEEAGTRREVAIKELFPSVFCSRAAGSATVIVGGTGNEVTMQRLTAQFLNEAEHLKTLDCKGIVKVYSSFKANNTAYYVMDYIKGQSLKEMVRTQGKLGETRALKYIGEVAESLEYLHNKRIVHRDVKPANIIIRERDNYAVLIDFGLSMHFTREGDVTQTMPHAITDGFASREQYLESLKRSFSPTLDIYSLGATLYYLLTGKVPPIATERRSNSLPFPAGFPQKLKYPIEKAMTIEKEDRYQSVRRFISALRYPAVQNFADKNAYQNPTSHTSTQTRNESTRVIGGSPSGKKYGNSVKNTPNGGKSTNQWMIWVGILIVGAIIALAIIFSVSKNNSYNGPDDYEIDTSEIGIGFDPLDDEQSENAMTVEAPQYQSASRSFSISGFNYNEKYNVRVDNGTLDVNGDEYKCNPNIDAEKIIDQYEGLAYFLAAENEAKYIINSNGFYAEERMNATLKFLKKSMEFLGPNKGNSTGAYNDLTSWYNQLKAIHNDWSYSDSYKDEWERDLEIINHGMGENPIQAKDIYYKF